MSERPVSFLNRTFDPGGPYEFRMERHYLVYAISGVMRLEAAGKRWTLTPSRAALLSAGTGASVTILAKIEAASVLFDTSFMGMPEQELAVFDMPVLGREILRECRALGESEEALSGYETALFKALAENIMRAAITPSAFVLPAPSSPELVRAVSITEENARNQIDLSFIARESGQSTRSLTRKFRKELGMSWGEYLRRLRVILAVEALGRTERPITEIALSVGYDSISGFNTAFRDLTGQTPSGYRESCRERD